MVTINTALVLDIDVSTHAQSVYMNHNYMRLHRGGSRIVKDGHGDGVCLGGPLCQGRA